MHACTRGRISDCSPLHTNSLHWHDIIVCIPAVHALNPKSISHELTKYCSTQRTFWTQEIIRYIYSTVVCLFKFNYSPQSFFIVSLTAYITPLLRLQACNKHFLPLFLLHCIGKGSSWYKTHSMRNPRVLCNIRAWQLTLVLLCLYIS